jgi:hypothetical protein
MVRLNKHDDKGFSPVKQGNSYYFLIPDYLVKSDNISVSKKYNIDVTEVSS